MVLTAFVRGRVRPRTSGGCSWDVLKLVGRVEGAISFGQQKLRVPCACLLSGGSRSIEDSRYGHQDEFFDPRLKESLASTEATKPRSPNSTIREALRVLGSLEQELQSESTNERQNRRNRRSCSNLGKWDSSTAAQDAYETYAASLAREGRIDDVFCILHRQEERERPVSFSLYRSLLLSLRRTPGLHGDERVDLVLQTMRRMKEEGLTLGRQEYLTLLSVMARTRNRQNLTLAAGKIQSMGIDLEWKEYAQLMAAFARQGEVQEARTLFQAVMRKFFQPKARGHGRWSQSSRPSSLENDDVGVYKMLKSDTEDVSVTQTNGKTADLSRVSSKEGVTNTFAPVSRVRASDGAPRSSHSEDSKVKLKFVDALIRCLGKNGRGEEALWALWAFKGADPELEVNQRVLHSLLKALVISGNFEAAVAIAKYVGSLTALPPSARPHRSNARVTGYVLSKQNRRNWEIFISSNPLARQIRNDRHHERSLGAGQVQSHEGKLHIGLEVETQKGQCDEQICVSLPKLFRGSSVHLDPKAIFIVLDAMLQEGRTRDVDRFSEYIWQHRRASQQPDTVTTRPHGVYGTGQKCQSETIDGAGDLVLQSYLHRLRALRKRGDWRLIKVLTNESLRLVEKAPNDEHGGEHEDSRDGRSLTSSNDHLLKLSSESLRETVSIKSERDWRKKESLLFLYAKARRSDSVRDLYLQLASERESLTRASFEALIEMYCLQGEVEKALAMLEMFLKKRVSNSKTHCDQSELDSNRAKRTVEGYVTVQVGSETTKDMETAFGSMGRKGTEIKSQIKSHLNCGNTNVELGMKGYNQQDRNQRSVGNDSQTVIASDVLANDGPRARTFSPLLRYFMRFRDAEGVEWVLDKMKKENIGLALSDSVQLLRYYVSEFSDRSDIALLDFVFKKLPQCGCSMDNVLCTELLMAFNRARGRESRERCAAAAKTLMKKVEAAVKLRPDKLYYSTLLSIFCKAQWLKEVTHVVQKMNESFLYLGIDDCNNVISACCQSGNRQLAEAILRYLELASESSQGVDLELRSSKNSRGQSIRSGSLRVVDLFEQRVAEIETAVERSPPTHPVKPGGAGGDLDPTEHWGLCIDGQTEDATWHHTVEKRVLQTSMTEMSKELPFSTGSPSVDQRVRAQGEEESSGGTEEEALPDSRVWEDLTVACEKALQLSVNDVIDLQTTHPDCVTYGCLMQYHGERGQVEEMEKYLNRMQERGVRPNTASFNILLSAYGGSAGSGDEFPREKLLRTIEIFKTQQISASPRTHSILLRLVRDGVIE